MSTEHPYKITYRPDSGSKRRTVVWFGPSMQQALVSWKQSEAANGRDGEGALIERAGVDAEARVRGVLRGGRVYRDSFYYHDSNGPQEASLEDVTKLRFLEDNPRAMKG